ncbi:hypothetical protein ANK1_1175 [plant metagenome]|uniref:Uncharacterized protein n=1 Tax=plant metagenome TaxID=1297885 RepID=A0A484T700_9ZZZZ
MDYGRRLGQSGLILVNFWGGLQAMFLFEIAPRTARDGDGTMAATQCVFCNQAIKRPPARAAVKKAGMRCDGLWRIEVFRNARQRLIWQGCMRLAFSLPVPGRACCSPLGHGIRCGHAERSPPTHPWRARARAGAILYRIECGIGP